MSVTAIILTNTINDEVFKTTNNCIESLVASEPLIDFEVIVVESNKSYYDLCLKYTSSSIIEIIIPDVDFNFHRYLNIGIKKASHSLLILSNNDVLYKEKWLSEILSVKRKHKAILSFSPYDLLSPYHKAKFKNMKDEFFYGYNVREEIAGYCIVVDRKVFEITNHLLDERFNFYYADDDYAMMLRRHQIKHALVLNSHIEHLGSINTKVYQKVKGISYIDNSVTIDSSLPKYLYTEDYLWIVKNKKALHGFLTFHNKWGNRRMLGLKYRIEKLLTPFNIKWLFKILYKPS